MNAGSVKRCPECNRGLRLYPGPYEYSREFGLNPAEYHLDLEGLTVTACACGVGFDVESMEALVPRIALRLLESNEALRPSGFHYLRRPPFHRPTVIPRNTGVSSMLAERAGVFGKIHSLVTRSDTGESDR